MESTNAYVIDFKNLDVGQHSFEYRVGEQLFGLYEGCEVLDGDCKVTVQMQRNEAMLQLVVDIIGDVKVECDRCLDPCNININFNAPLIVKFTDDATITESEYDGEVMWLPTASKQLDLTHYIYESIILSLPYQRVHEDGECNPEMIEKFKVISPEEFEQLEQESNKVETQTLPQQQLDKLQALKSQLKADE